MRIHADLDQQPCINYQNQSAVFRNLDPVSGNETWLSWIQIQQQLIDRIYFLRFSNMLLHSTYLGIVKNIFLTDTVST
jgi:hypothetical protein